MLEIHVPRPLAKLAWTFAPATRLILRDGWKTISSRQSGDAQPVLANAGLRDTRFSTAEDEPP